MIANSNQVAAGTLDALDVRQVSHWFSAPGERRGTVQALNDVSLRAAPGTFLSIVGPSGCGKTTLLNIIGGLEPLQSGAVTVNGAPVRTGRDDVAYMFARPALMPWRTAVDNVKFGMQMRKASHRECEATARYMLERVGLSGFEKAYPKQLSQGMRQRVALARTFAVESRTLLMDEPFGALDAQTKLMLEETLLGLWESRAGSTVIFVTHDLGEAVAVSDRVVIMSRRPGRLIADVDIDLPRPRTVLSLQESPHYHELLAMLWRYLRQAMADDTE